MLLYLETAFINLGYSQVAPKEGLAVDPMHRAVFADSNRALYIT
jgi:hypothetical protein